MPGATRAAKPDRTYEIHEVAELTGLAASRLRAWERRYEVIRPRRMPNGYRVYSAEQVALLRAYARLIEAGERIGDLAARRPEDVLARAAETRPLDGSPNAALVEAVHALDRERLEGLVAQQLALRGLRAFAAEVVPRLAASVGDQWAAGRLPVAAEHLATEVVLHALKGGIRMSRGGGPRVVAGCLPGERHEWGVLAALAVLQEDGWRVHYFGADLPVQELAGAAWRLSAEAVALSGSDPALVRAALPALAPLPGRLPPGSLAVIGGRGAEPHAAALRGYGFRLGPDGLAAADSRRDRTARL